MNIQKSNLDNTFEQQKHDAQKNCIKDFETRRCVKTHLFFWLKNILIVEMRLRREFKILNCFYLEKTLGWEAKLHRILSRKKKQDEFLEVGIYYGGNTHTHTKVGCCRVWRNFDVHQLNNYAKCL
jgi:hypothetical protein